MYWILILIIIFRLRISWCSLAITLLISVITLSFIKRRNGENKILSCFNFRKYLLSVIDFTPNTDEITCFHGFRALALVMVVVMHSIFVIASKIEPHSELYNMKLRGNGFIHPFFLNAVVDVFFVISAILLTRSILKDLRKWVNS